MAFGSRADRPRRGTPADWLVVGLGNPGKEYAGSRHNVGFEVVDLLARRHDGRLKAGKERALVTEVRVDGQRVALAEPTTYMNLSGESVVQLVRRFGVDDPERLVVVQDELRSGLLVAVGQSRQLRENFYAITAPRRHRIEALERLLAQPRTRRRAPA